MNFPSGPIAIRSHPPSYRFSHKILSDTKSKHVRNRSVLTYNRRVAAHAHTPFTFSGFPCSSKPAAAIRFTNRCPFSMSNTSTPCPPYCNSFRTPGTAAYKNFPSPAPAASAATPRSVPAPNPATTTASPQSKARTEHEK